MVEIIKTTLKLLFRNKGFWFFIIITPVLSTFILKVKQENISAYEDTGKNEIVELDSMDSKVAYYGGNGRYTLKVYDASESELSKYLLNKLLESGAFTVCRVKVPDMTKKDIEAHLHTDGYDDRMGAAIYLEKDFDDKMIEGDVKDALSIYILSDDERQELLENEIKMCAGQIRNAVNLAGNENVTNTLDEMNKVLPAKKVKAIVGNNHSELTDEQREKKTLMGYAFAILTLGYVFGGIYVAHTVIKEQKDMVLTRIKLTNLTNGQYFSSKFICGAVVSFMMTFIMGICTVLFGEKNMGISLPVFLLMIFLMGLIFCAISLLFGILLGNVMSANVAAFTIWSMSALLAGLYFPLDHTTKAVKALSYMMPQKWFFEATEMIMTKDSKVYFMLLCITVAYLIVTLSLGSVGIKYKNYE